MNFSGITRRSFLGAAAAVIGATVLPAGRAGAATRLAKAAWPSKATWAQLNARVGGRLIQPVTPWASLKSAIIPQRLKNPWYLEEQAGATQSTGMFKAWTSTASTYAVAAESTQDIVAAVNFARENKVRIVVKGTGHDYFGRSSAPRSLLVWTHNMRKVTIHKSFRPAGAPSSVPAEQAVSVLAGNRWLEAYQGVTKAGRYVQGGGCTSVGACGGFALGGGFGSHSKRFGSGAAGVLEIEVITADGKVRVTNKYQNADLFWAMRGGGGGTFGIVSRMTLLTHPMPSTSGWLSGSITAKSDDSYRELIRRYLSLIEISLNSPAWGEGVTFVKGENKIELGTSFLDMSVSEAKAIWAPLLDELRSRPADYTVNANFSIKPFVDKWDPTKNDGVIMDDRVGAPSGYYWWSGNAVEVGAYWGGYQGRGVPLKSIQGDQTQVLADAIFNATRTSLVLLQTNKALSGEHPEAATRDRETSLNPAVFDNAAFVTMGDWVQYKYVGVAGHEPDMAIAQSQFDGVNKAMDFVTAATPGGASYSNEGNYFEPNWQSEFWGSNYPRLLRIKNKYDPQTVFWVHHGVGSERSSG